MEIKAILLGVPIAGKFASKAALLTVVVHPQWSRMCELVMVHLWRHMCVRWAPNGTMDQPLGMLVAGQSAIGTEKKSTFFAVTRNFVCAPDPVFPDQKATIEHLLATDRLSEQGESCVTKKFPPSGTL